jgi:hypothetical protein
MTRIALLTAAALVLRVFSGDAPTRSLALIRKTGRPCSVGPPRFVGASCAIAEDQLRRTFSGGNLSPIHALLQATGSWAVLSRLWRSVAARNGLCRVVSTPSDRSQNPRRAARRAISPARASHSYRRGTLAAQISIAELEARPSATQTFPAGSMAMSVNGCIAPPT